MFQFVLDGVSYMDIVRYPKMEIAEGVTTFITGQSGTGKSTLLKILNNTCSACGDILYRGEPIESYEPIALRREVLLAGQSPFLFDKTIRENFQEFHSYRDSAPPLDADISRYLQTCAVDFSPNADCSTLSGGERQRVFIAVCLSFSPSTLLLDEPTSALDERSSRLLMENITRHCNENAITLVVVSHNLMLCKNFAQSVIELRR